MTGFEITLLILAFAGLLVSCGFGIRWLQTRDSLADATRQWQGAEAERQVLKGKVAQLDAKHRKTVNAFNDLRAQAKQKIEAAAKFGYYWKERFERIAHWESVEDAVRKAREIQDKVFDLERTAEALRNAVEGYGSQYVLPPHSVLDDLASEAGHTDAGQRLKAAREASRKMVKRGEAVSSSEEDPERKALIESFVVDAFNCKVEAIMEAVKADNIGTLMQRVNDAFLLVNRQSKAFANARILKPYLTARLDELRWASLVQQYKKDEREEQRIKKEQMREEAILRREAERLQRETEEQAETARVRAAELEKAREEAEREAKSRYEQELASRLAVVSAEERAAVQAEMQAKHAMLLETQRAEFEGRLSEQAALLRDALARGQRALSMAQQVKKGHVYIISNEGSFGQGVFKIGQTRRGAVEDDRKQERIDELGDASVPFEFDVHAWLPSENAPELERQLQRRFVLNQVNKMNWRKEFFRVSLSEIRKVVEEMGIAVEWTMLARAKEYRETLALEQRMASDPVERDRWVAEQLDLESEEEAQDASELRDAGSGAT
jgi:hypothetical protein